jgi:hypothetical protein
VVLARHGVHADDNEEDDDVVMSEVREEGGRGGECGDGPDHRRPRHRCSHILHRVVRIQRRQGQQRDPATTTSVVASGDPLPVVQVPPISRVVNNCLECCCGARAWWQDRLHGVVTDCL